MAPLAPDADHLKAGFSQTISPTTTPSSSITAASPPSPATQKDDPRADLLASAEEPTPGSLDGDQAPNDASPPDANMSEDIWEDVDETSSSDLIPPTAIDAKPRTDPVPKKKRLTPDQATLNLYAKWRALLPSLIDPYLAYSAATTGKKLRPLEGNSFNGKCCVTGPSCKKKEISVLCLFWDLDEGFIFSTLRYVADPGIDVHADDWIVQGEQYREPFQHSFGHAAQWLDGLRVLVEKGTDTILDEADTFLRTVNSGPTANPPLLKQTIRDIISTSPPCSSDLNRPSSQALDNLSLSTPPPSLVLPPATLSYAIPSHTSPSLVQPSSATATDLDNPSLSTPPPSLISPPATLSYAVPSHTSPSPVQPISATAPEFGQDLADGGDFQIATDGNFHHHHLVSAGQSVPFHDPKHVIPKAFIDEVGEAILKAWKSPLKKHKPKVLDSAVDECEKAHEAADGDKKKVNEGQYDDMGWMSLVCRHDIPLFFANIDMPGKQQKYSVALILWFFALIPANATVTALYDIACILECSIELFDFLPAHVVSRVQFVTTAMHAYRHQWSCQLMYNPRLCRGLGLTDGEGVERMWACLRKLISLVRTSSRAHQIWLTDHQLSAIAFDLRVDLADWIKCHWHKGMQDQGARAKAVIEKCGMTQSDLRIQWDLQKSAQMSVRVHAPNKLKKELDLLLSLQGDLELVDKSIRATEASLATSTMPEKSKEILKGLYESHSSFTDCIEALYASLNFYDSYPDLKGANLEFVRTLLLAHDLKINIRKRAIGSFFEWDRLDQAIGGRNQALGIHANVKLDRCQEEEKRLTYEVDNLCAWFGWEMCAVELAIRAPRYSSFLIPLSDYRDHLLHLKCRWGKALGLTTEFNSHVNRASLNASALVGNAEVISAKAVYKLSDPEEIDDHIRDDPEESPDDFDNQLVHDQLSNEEDATVIAFSDILQMEKDDPDDTSSIEFSEECMALAWTPTHLDADTWLCNCQSKILSMAFSGQHYVERKFSTYSFGQKELESLDSKRALLNDICINGLGGLLQTLFSKDPIRGHYTHQSALFTIYEMNHIRYRAPDAELWPTEHHWVLAVIYPRCRKVYLYDSLARNSNWKHDMISISIFISHIIELANRADCPTDAIPTGSFVLFTRFLRSLIPPSMDNTANDLSGAEPLKDMPTNLALWRFTKKLARFNPQAKADGQKAEFDDLVKCLLEARWPGAFQMKVQVESLSFASEPQVPDWKGSMCAGLINPVDSCKSVSANCNESSGGNDGRGGEGVGGSGVDIFSAPLPSTWGFHQDAKTGHWVMNDPWYAEYSDDDADVIPVPTVNHMVNHMNGTATGNAKTRIRGHHT
ncbi:hypothetical protein CPB84DRAFT_1856057 [Gymnopilus junonius]|uniref:Ubiquitin-like protease family profile domain-containing protein n=1 Tax=Gymnopilus junonius TaxID=109634 RepID=A0A9P5TFJ4_GYMJU|nr:hypothetical protein CPB84DRAFT_1856057 [Gymnopilus junonius]